MKNRWRISSFPEFHLDEAHEDKFLAFRLDAVYMGFTYLTEERVMHIRHIVTSKIFIDDNITSR
jgi:hypothetical protein